MDKHRRKDMLILTRGIDGIIRIGDDILVKVLGVKGFQVRIGVEAPDDMAINRGEIYDKIKATCGEVTVEGRAEYLEKKAKGSDDE